MALRAFESGDSRRVGPRTPDESDHELRRQPQSFLILLAKSPPKSDSKLPLRRSTLPPSTTGQPYYGKPYIVEAYGGENVYVPTLAGTTRYLVPMKESNNNFTIVGGAGVAPRVPVPVPFHHHKQMHHDFLVLKGQLKVWLNEDCRIMSQGDYASVSPVGCSKTLRVDKGTQMLANKYGREKTVHSYQLLSPHTEILGIITARAFEPFFLKIGDHYEGHLWPDVDDRDSHAILPQRVKEAAQEFDVIPVPGYKAANPKPWSDKTDDQPRPGPYFLQNGRGPSAVLGGTVVRPLITGIESDNTFTLGTIEGSSAYKTQALKGGFKFSSVNHALHVSDGYIRATVDGDTERVGPGELLWLPAGALFSIDVDTRYFKSYIYSQPGGLIDLLYQAGKDSPHTGINCMIPESPVPFDREKLLSLRSQFEFTFQ